MAETQGPFEFRRMISWQLSQDQEQLESSSTSRKKQKRHKHKLSDKTDGDSFEIILKQPDTIDSSDESKHHDTTGYLVVNSDGEEEVFYSAPESPVISEDEENMYDKHSEVAVKSIKLTQEDCTKKRLSKKKKKRCRRTQRMARLDFFQPLCDLFDESFSPDIQSMDLSNYSSVPSLSEICLWTIKKMPIDQLELDLPFLISSLVSNDRLLSSVVSGHVQWLEKFLGELEKYIIRMEKATVKKDGKKAVMKENKYIYNNLMSPWEYKSRPVGVDDLRLENSPHDLVPGPYLRRTIFVHEFIIGGEALRHLLHYSNFFYPVTLDDHVSKKTKSGPLSSTVIHPMQRSAIDRVNYRIKNRYAKISHIYSKSLKIWPAYIHWARGNLLLAANAFASEIETCEVFDRPVLLNEMARMFLYFGDRSSAVSSYMKSAEIVLPLKDGENVHQRFKPLLIRLCSKASQAGVWDTGILDISTAAKASYGWNCFLRECSEVDFPTDIWFLHVAAIESKLRVHAGKHILSTTPEVKKVHGTSSESVVTEWLNDCEKLLTSHNLLDQFPILYYHLSLIYALKGKTDSSELAFDSFLNDFAGFHQWGNIGLPGRLFQSIRVPHQQHPHPWHNLFALTQQVSQVPILPLHWRVQLVHSMHPYTPYNQYSMIADHSPDKEDINFRLTSTGYLTGDLVMDLPPMRSVLIDPYNGNLHFERMSSLQHYSLNANGQSVRQHLPWPLRVYESSDCVIELCMAHRVDLEYHTNSEVNYMSLLHWYGSDGSHYKLDLRRLIRKEYKKEIMKTIEKRTDISLSPETAAKYLDKMMEQGLSLSIDHFYCTNVPLTKYDDKGARTCPLFILYLNSHVVFGKGTLMLTFTLEKDIIGDHHMANVILFINCASLESFLNPKIYCDCHSSGFSNIWPTPDIASDYITKCLHHIKYAVLFHTERTEHLTDANNTNSYLLFNEDGDIINRWTVKGHVQPVDHEVLGHRLFYLDSDNTWFVTSQIKTINSSIYMYSISCDIMNHDKSHRGYPIQFPSRLVTVPGLLLVICEDGLTILHPGTLERLNIIGLRSTDGVDPPQDGFIYPQFLAFNADSVFVMLIYDVSISDDNDSRSVVTSVDDDDELLPDDITDYGSCKVAISVNERVIVLKCTPRTTDVSVVFDVSLPGRPVYRQFHVLPEDLGFLVCTSQFPDCLRMDLYWLSPVGTLLGLLPCLGPDHRSFLSVTLSPQYQRRGPLSTTMESTNNDKEPGGTYVYFDDGLGGICCIRLQDVVN